MSHFSSILLNSHENNINSRSSSAKSKRLAFSEAHFTAVACCGETTTNQTKKIQKDNPYRKNYRTRNAYWNANQSVDRSGLNYRWNRGSLNKDSNSSRTEAMDRNSSEKMKDLTRIEELTAGTLSETSTQSSLTTKINERANKVEKEEFQERKFNSYRKKYFYQPIELNSSGIARNRNETTKRKLHPLENCQGHTPDQSKAINNKRHSYQYIISNGLTLASLQDFHSIFTRLYDNNGSEGLEVA